MSLITLAMSFLYSLLSRMGKVSRLVFVNVFNYGRIGQMVVDHESSEGWLLIGGRYEDEVGQSATSLKCKG